MSAASPQEGIVEAMARGREGGGTAKKPRGWSEGRPRRRTMPEAMSRPIHHAQVVAMEGEESRPGLGTRPNKSLFRPPLGRTPKPHYSHLPVSPGGVASAPPSAGARWLCGAPGARAVQTACSEVAGEMQQEYPREDGSS